MKNLISLRSVKLACALILLLVLSGFGYYAVEKYHRSPTSYLASKQISIQDALKVTQIYPKRLEIPSINVNAKVEYVTRTDTGAMGIPNNTSNVGWYALGPRPGEKGSAVISGHFDTQTGDPGVFTNLHNLKKGDKIYITDGSGASTTFQVETSHSYTPGTAPEVFSKNDTAHLNLITCDGFWDSAKKSYSKRLVVFADIVK